MKLLNHIFPWLFIRLKICLNYFILLFKNYFLKTFKTYTLIFQISFTPMSNHISLYYHIKILFFKATFWYKKWLNIIGYLYKIYLHSKCIITKPFFLTTLNLFLNISLRHFDYIFKNIIIKQANLIVCTS